MFLSRKLSAILKKFSKFPVVALLGPRQSGKTTLVKHSFTQHAYVNLEDLELRSFAINDPKGFLNAYENEFGIILDEFQNAPEMLSYIQVIVDEKKRPGYFVLIGSQNFLMNAAITQSLAGRVGILTLLPFSIQELHEHNLLPALQELIFQGGYPRIYADTFLATELYPSYVHTYIERDVRQLAHVGDIHIFQQFMKLCAGRIGQLLNIADIAVQCGIKNKTAQEWLSVLEASYIIFLLKPYFKNFNKRIVKTPKLFFYDTGLACSLLGLRSSKDIVLSPFKGHLFENVIIADFYKQYYNRGITPPLYFWRDQNARLEIDCLIESSQKLYAIEIKAGQTVIPSFFDTLNAWHELTKEPLEQNYLIYGGGLTQMRYGMHLVSWKECYTIVAVIEQ